MWAIPLVLIGLYPITIDGDPSDWLPTFQLDGFVLQENPGDAFPGFDFIDLYATYGNAHDSLYFAFFVDQLNLSYYYWTVIIINSTDTFYVRNNVATVPGSWGYNVSQGFVEYGIPLDSLGIGIGGASVQFLFLSSIDDRGIFVIDFAPDLDNQGNLQFFTLQIPVHVKEIKNLKPKRKIRKVLSGNKIVIITQDEKIIDITGRKLIR